MPAQAPDILGDEVPYGVLDVGSNSIRLVVFGALTRAPEPIFNERELCGLGSDLGETGRLAPSAIQAALETLRRFASVVRVLGVGQVDAVTTAAVRDATDGHAFCALVERETGFRLRTLSGEEEARYAALGIVSAFPNANGLMADLGGGSLELVRLEAGQVTDYTTLPLGVLRLGMLSRENRIALASAQLAAIPWLAGMRESPAYLVGGAWRALARIRIAETAYPIPIVHHFTLDRLKGAAVAVAHECAPSAPAVGKNIRQRRLDTVPSGAAVLTALLDVVAPNEVIFSAYGLREGLLYDRLPAATRADDPLLAACRDLDQREGRAPGYAAALDRWLQRAGFPGASAHRRLWTAAALLSEIAWRTHPDFRAADSFARVARAPFVGIDHTARVFLAAAVATRYESDSPDDANQVVEAILSPEVREEARVLGLALRLAERLSCGEPSVLDKSELVLTPAAVTLRLAPQDRPLLSGKANDAGTALAEALDREFHVAESGDLG
jgi:exopolyphosphatase/guanosine-5'-triphosphate,3'-diphosphate pyrophosphatase